MAKSMQKAANEVRGPRVKLEIDVEEGGAKVKKELPFVVGVIGDYSGDADKKPYRERKFVDIDRDNFDRVMERIGPELNFRVENAIDNDGSELPVSLSFKRMADFEPAAIAQQVEPLARLLQQRALLKDLLSAMDRGAKLDAKINQILADDDLKRQLADALGLSSNAPSSNDNASEDA